METTETPNELTAVGTTLYKNTGINLEQAQEFEFLRTQLSETGMRDSEARFYAAREITSLTYDELADVFDVSRGTINSASLGTSQTLRNTLDRFVQFVDGPKTVNVKVTNTTHDEISRDYICTYSDSVGRVIGKTERCVISFRTNRLHGGGFDDKHAFKSVDVSRYDSIDELAADYYENTTFENIHDAYRVASVILEERDADTWKEQTRDLTPPQERVESHVRDREAVVLDGDLYVKDEETDSLSTMESTDADLIEYDGEYVDVVLGRDGMDSYSVRDTMSGAEIEHFTPDEANYKTATLYENLGPTW